MKRAILVFLTLVVFPALAAFAGPPTGLTSMERLGRHLFKDKNLSYNGTQSCQVCHHPFAGFADRRNQLDPVNSVVSTGADGVSLGGRNAPTAAYAGFSPNLGLVGEQWVGGLFWDGRADGYVLGDPLAEQAQGPPLNPVEMKMPDKEAVIAAIESSAYANLFLRVFGPGAFDDVDVAYDNFGRAVAAYERSKEVTRFTSRFDTAASQFSDAEKSGRRLFQKNCSACHATKAEFGAPEALFTSYGYYNIGVPANPLVYWDGGDPGLGATVADLGYPEDVAALQMGKFKVPTLRNIALSPPYSHNGYFPTLREMVSFLNDSSDFLPELDANIDSSVGAMGLSESEIDDIVSFLMTLTDQ